MKNYPYETTFGEILDKNEVDRAFDIDTDIYYDVIAMVGHNTVKIHDSGIGWNIGLNERVMIEQYYDGTIIVINRENSRALRFILGRTVEIKL